jgi:hypothetical protein
MVATAHADSIWNVGIKTAAAQNMVAVNFIKQQPGHDIRWMEWFTAAFPYFRHHVHRSHSRPDPGDPPGNRGDPPPARRSPGRNWQLLGK